MILRLHPSRWCCRLPGTVESEHCEPFLTRCRVDPIRLLGPNHRDMAAYLENYAVLLRNLDRSEEATRLEARAQAIRAEYAFFKICSRD